MNQSTTRPTVSHHSETNAVSERFNRTIMAMTRAQLVGSGCPKNLWPLAVGGSELYILSSVRCIVLYTRNVCTLCNHRKGSIDSRISAIPIRKKIEEFAGIAQSLDTDSAVVI